MIRRNHQHALAVCLVAASLAPQASASGFQLREQSPSAQGTAFAGVSAGGPDSGSMFFNPATMTLFQGDEAVIGFSYVAPKAELGNASGKRAAALGGGTITGPRSTSDVAKNALLPNLYAMWSVGPDLKLGLSVNAPFGMATDYDADFAGRYHALKSDLQVMDFAPTLAYRINSRWSLGAALVARKAEAELTNAVDFGALLGAPGAFDGLAKLKGDKWGFGYRLGVVFEPTEQIRLGLAHHSAMSMTLEGDATYTGVPAPLAATFRNGGATAELKLPSTTSLGVRIQASGTVTLHGEIARTGWSTFKELRVKSSNGLPDSVTEENWRDTWFYALGLTWQATEAWTIRSGVAYDQGAVPDADRTPRIPDGDRTWLSLGAGYAFSRNVAVDAAYTHIFVTDGEVDLKAVPAGSTFSNSPNKLRGDLSGTYQSSIDILSVQARFRF